MNKLNIGDYVRTKKGTIYQFNSTSSKALSGAKKYMVKSSPRIIDLIEVGDYVNGCRVNDVYSPDGKNVFRIELEVDGLKGHIISKSKNIKSIVTKESFENISYKVGE